MKLLAGQRMMSSPCSAPKPADEDRRDPRDRQDAFQCAHDISPYWRCNPISGRSQPMLRPIR